MPGQPSPRSAATARTRRGNSLPYLRFSRDKRGYENTFVVQGERRRGKGRPRVLYWFRTPPGVKVGRAALDEDAIRLLEELNPEVDFDWTRILKGGAPVEEPRQPGVHGRRSTDRPRWPDGRRKDERRPAQPAVEHPERATEWTTPAATEMGGGSASSAAEAQPIPDHTEEPPPLTDAPPTAAHARLGSEGVSRLRGRYAEILARITERVPDVARREELKSLAERLNPDSWVTDAEVTAGLEEYEGVFESLRAVVGRRKRRRRRGGRRDGQEGELAAEGPAPGPAETASREEAPGPEEDSDAEDF